MATLLDSGIFSVIGTASQIGEGWKLKSYRAGTSTQIDTYPTSADAEAGTNPNPWPVVLGADGRVPPMWYTQAAKVILTDPDDVPKGGGDNVVSTADYATQDDITTLESEITALGARVTTLEGGPTCLIVVNDGQSLTIARSPQVTSPGAIPVSLLMPVGGAEWPSMTAPAPLSVGSRPVVPSNFASFVSWVQPTGCEGNQPGMAWQLEQYGYSKIISWNPGVGGTSLSLHLAGGGTTAGASGPYFANIEAFLRHAVNYAEQQGLEPVIAWILNLGHADADLLNDGGTATTESTQAEFLYGLNKYSIHARLAAMRALGTPWTDPIWIVPLVTGQGSSYTLTGRKQVAAAQLQACTGGVPGMRMLGAHSQFAPYFEGDLIHPGGQAFRYYGEVEGLSIAQALGGSPRTVPYITATSVISGTQVEVTFSEAVQISSAVIEATTAGVQAGLEAYTAGGAQIPLTAAAQGSASNKIVVTMASTATFSKIRNGLAQETTGAATKMVRTRICSPTPLGTAQDGTVLYVFSPAQEF